MPHVLAGDEAIEIPETLEESIPLQEQLHDLLRRIQDITNKRERRIAVIRANATDALEELEREARRIADALFAYAGPHRAELTEDGKQNTVTTAAGKMQWYKGPPALLIVGDEKELIAEFERRRSLGQFLRVLKSLDREAILTNLDFIKKKRIRGLSIESRDFFALSPKGEGAQVVCDTRKPDSWIVRLPKKKLKKK